MTYKPEYSAKANVDSAESTMKRTGSRVQNSSNSSNSSNTGRADSGEMPPKRGQIEATFSPKAHTDSAEFLKRSGSRIQNSSNSSNSSNTGRSETISLPGSKSAGEPSYSLKAVIS